MKKNKTNPIARISATTVLFIIAIATRHVMKKYGQTKLM